MLLPDYPVPSAQYFMERLWWTPAQIRDSLLIRHTLTLEFIHECKVLAIQEQARRKSDPACVECPRCRGYHGQKDNIEAMCEQCEATTAPFRFDSANFGEKEATILFKGGYRVEAL